MPKANPSMNERVQELTIRIFFATDVHGSDVCFRKFINAHAFYKADVLILGGDLTGKAVIPIVKGKDGTFHTDYFGTKYIIKSQSELENLKKKLSNMGFYPYITTETQLQMLKDENKMVEIFKQLAIERIEEWIKLADERLKDMATKMIVCPGNDDGFYIDNLFEKSKKIINAEGKIIEIFDKNDVYEVANTGYANITPWNCPRDVSENDLERKIESIVSHVKNMKNAIFQFHCPPHGTNLDVATKLVDLKPIPGSTIAAGSTAVRKAIEKYQPLLGLHGHIHESRGFYKIGRTLCINPGSEYGEGILRAALIDLDKGKIKNFSLIQG
jgi:Icc-related predicted phosphoesterase